MKRLTSLVFLAISALVLAAGCSSILAPRPDPTKFYVLTPLANTDAAQPAPPAAHPLAIGLGPINFPDYLAHLEVVTRVSPNRVDLSATDRWAEPLEDSFRRVLALNLATLLGTDRIVPFPWYASAENKLNYRIEITVERFERDGSGGTQLVANWIIRGGHSDRPLVSRLSNFSESAATASGAAASGTSMDAAAAALSADLSDLSKQIADAVTALNSVHPRD
jgi:uncharacterized lipoprotein YmbA